MSSCARNASDPLLQLLLTKYHLNLLQTPREGVQLGELVIQRAEHTPLQCRLLDIFSGTPPNLKAGPPFEVTDIHDKFSDHLDANAGLSLFDKLLHFVPGASAKARGAYRSAQTMQISLDGVTREDIDVGALSRFLRQTSIKRDQTLLREGDNLYIIASVFRATGMEIKASDAGGRDAHVELGVKGFGEGEAAITATNKSGSRILYRGKKALAVGVCLLAIDAEDGAFRLRTVDKLVNVRDVKLNDKDYALLGDPMAGPAFLEFDSDA
jgi:hypothetical protein